MHVIDIYIQFPARASYNLNVEVLSYASTTHVKSDGFCCRTPINLVCTDHCNNRFTFCVRPTGVNTSDSTGACLDSAQQLATGSISDDMMEFEIGRNLDAGIPNPLVFTADRWPVRFLLFLFSCSNYYYFQGFCGFLCEGD